MDGRKLTDADVEAIVDAFERRFYLNLGKGIWAQVWKAIVLVAVGIAAAYAVRK